ncbi:helix-turn-helix domain-containing protein [Brevundimonas variabilis]|uniref:Chromosomal replication initiation ATPase DnaA n=1 Tax=Brevundimonas variabilis TaxID=74312 RepID=A0A7W9FGP0_9CAUL|nr:helix-turn-helix domain-containing protein [Brevundimonas variabilis]MBB5746848.1 chromosomal replication initiation ATPase DnaA [Brevundimonas variabilis]
MTERYRVRVAEGDQIKAGLAMQMVALATCIPSDRMVSRQRQAPQVCRARWLSMYLTHVGFGWSLERVGHAFGFNRSTVAMACRWAEDARDRPELDAVIERMEATIRDICEGPALVLAPGAPS